MIIKDWFHENWGKTRRRFAWLPIEMDNYHPDYGNSFTIWWEYYDETLAGASSGPLGRNLQWRREYPSKCISKTFVKMK